MKKYILRNKEYKIKLKYINVIDLNTYTVYVKNPFLFGIIKKLHDRYTQKRLTIRIFDIYVKKDKEWIRLGSCSELFNVRDFGFRSGAEGYFDLLDFQILKIKEL